MLKVQEVPDTVFAEVRYTLKFGAPIVAGQLAQMSLGFIDTVMAGHLGPVDLAAVAIGRSVYMPGFIFVLGVLLAVNPIVAQFFGAKDFSKIGKSVRQGLWLSQIIAIPAFFTLRCLYRILEYIGIQPEIIPVTAGYLDALSWSLPAVFAYLVLRFFNDGISRSKPHMIFSLCVIPLNIVANYVLMYGKLGFPKMGAIGAGYATSLVWWCMLIAMLLLTVLGKTYKPFGIYYNLKLPDWHYFKEILRIGIPNGVSLAMEISMFAIVALLIGSMGVAIVAAHQVAINIASIMFMFPLGFSIATTSRVGIAAGQKSLTGVLIAGKAGLWISSAAAAFTAALMFFFPQEIVAIYTDDSEVIRLAVSLIFMAALFQFSDSIQVSAAGALRGMKDTKIPMVVNIIAYWLIGLSFGYYLGMISHWGAEGLWIGLIIGLTFAAIAHTIRFFYLARRKQPPFTR